MAAGRPLTGSFQVLMAMLGCFVAGFGCTALDTTPSGNWQTMAARVEPSLKQKSTTTAASKSSPYNAELIRPRVELSFSTEQPPVIDAEVRIAPASYQPAKKPPIAKLPGKAGQKTGDAGMPDRTAGAGKLHPISLTAAFRLAGANNRQIALAVEKIREAQARYSGARALWLPTISAGIGYNKHDGRLQETEGNILEISRSSLFVGGGAGLSSGLAATGGASGPARLAVDFSLAEGIFEPLAKRQLARAAYAHSDAAFNDNLLKVALAYLDLAQAQGEIGIATEAVQNAELLIKQVRGAIQAGKARPADELRAKTDLAKRRRDVLKAQERVQVASAELARLLALDPVVTLIPLESHAAPISIVPIDAKATDLVMQAQSARSEVTRQDAIVQAATYEMRKERWRPWIPHLHVGVSAGGFGGSDGSQINDFDNRLDFDAFLVWQVRGLGLGNRAMQRESGSRNAQAIIQAASIRDIVAKEVVTALEQIRSRNRQIAVARKQTDAAKKSVKLHFQGIKSGVLRAIEAQQAVADLVQARQLFLRTVIDYNRSQFELLRAIGQPLSDNCK